jgi:heat shock protein HslJ
MPRGNNPEKEHPMRDRYAGRPVLPLIMILVAACAPASTPAEPEFLDVEWVVVEVNGVPVEADSTRPAPTLLVSRTDQRASGHAGCNQFGGEWQGGGDSLSFGPLMMTRMFCEGRMDLETRYGAALQVVTGVRVVDSMLELLAGDRVVVRARRGGRSPGVGARLMPAPCPPTGSAPANPGRCTAQEV